MGKLPSNARENTALNRGVAAGVSTGEGHRDNKEAKVRCLGYGGRVRTIRTNLERLLGLSDR